jgi:hypothetical protein
MVVIPKRDFKFWLNIFTFAALGLLVFISWDQIVEALRELDGLNTGALLLMIPIQAFSYFGVAKFYKTFLDKQGEVIKLWQFYKVALELNFVNNVFPSGGVSGFSYLSVRFKHMGISTAKSTLVQILRFSLTFLSFLLLLLFAVFALSLGSSTGGLIILISSAIIFATIFGTGVGVYIISKPSRIKAFVGWLPKAVNYVAKLFKTDKTTSLINVAKVERTLEDLHEDYMVLRRDKQLVKQLFYWALLVNVAEVLTVYMVYVAFGELINPGALIIAYAVANLAGLIAILPGGVGVYEGLMTATLASAGVPKALALSATVIYRVLSMIVFLPIGYFFYQQALKSTSALKATTEKDATKF